jgi:opacity protein-like surface antigen
MKRILAISALAMSLVTTVNAQDFTESYARANQNVTLDLQWSTENYGSVQWQLSTDDGITSFI